MTEHISIVLDLKGLTDLVGLHIAFELCNCAISTYPELTWGTLE